MATIELFSGVKIDNRYENAIHFKDSNDRYEWYRSLHRVGLISNFNFVYEKNNLTTNIVVEFNDSSILACNYARVHNAKSSPMLETYYFVTNVEILSDKVFRLYMELDVMTTFPFESMVTTNDEIFVKRKHCPRFYKYTTRSGRKNLIFAGDKEVLNSDEIDKSYRAPILASKNYFEQDTNPYSSPQTNANGVLRDEVVRFIKKFKWEYIVTKQPISTDINYRFISSGSLFVKQDSVVPSTLSAYYTNSGTDEIKFTQINNVAEIMKVGSETESGFYLYLAPVIDYNVSLEYAYMNYPIIGKMYGSVMRGAIWGFPSQKDVGSIIVNRFRVDYNVVYSFIEDCVIKGKIKIPSLNVPFENRYGTREITALAFDFTKKVNVPYKPRVGVFKSYDGESGAIRLTSTNFDEFMKYLREDIGNVIPINGSKSMFVTLSIGVWETSNERLFMFKNRNFSLFNILNYNEAETTQLKSVNYEPKLWAPPFRRYVATSLPTNSSELEINPLLNRSPLVKLKYMFLPSSSLLKIDMYCIPDMDLNLEHDAAGDYIAGSPYYTTSKSFIGSKSVIEYSLPIFSTAYEEFMRNRKNFAISSLAVPVASSLGVSAGTLLATEIGGGNILSSMAGASIGLASAMTSYLNYKTKVDDLKNTPNSIKNSGNDALFDSMYNDSTNPYVLEYVMTDSEQTQVLNYFYRFGYNTNDYYSIKQLFTRKIFNYVKLNDDIYDKIEIDDRNFLSYILVNYIPNVVKNKINDVLNNGLTFWEVSDYMFTHTQENMEKDEFILEISHGDLL